MEHLNLEALGGLVDEAPTAAEADHLDRCGRCASELDALRRQTAALGALPDVRPPRGDWEGVEARLLGEGMIRADEDSLSLTRRVAAATPWLRRAAAVAVFLTGAATGAGVTARVARAPADEGSNGTESVELASITDPGTALAQVQDAERAYIGALAHYRQLISARDGNEVMGDPDTRYAALEQVVRAGQAAVSQAPADLFLNGLLASALAERAAHRQLAPSASQDGWF
jgi:hypothetical protein